MSLPVTPRGGSDLNLNPYAPQYANAIMGQSSSSESKGLKRAGPYMRGAANSFGFRKNKINGNNNDKTTALEQRNYSQEALAKEQHNVTTAIKASPGLVRAQGKDAAPAPAAPAARTNRFGFRAPAAASAPASRGLSNKVGDSSAQVLASKGGAAVQAPAAARPATAPGTATAPARGPVGPKRPSPSAARPPVARVGGRPSPPTSLAVTRHALQPHPRPPAVQSHLPRPQFARVGNAKDAKTAANYGTRGLAPIATFDDEIGSSKESSVGDSGLGSQVHGDTDTLHGVDLMDISPRSGQRLRRAASTQPPRRSLRSLRDEEDDPNVITEIVPIAKVVSRASLRSIASVGGKNPTPSPKPLAARGPAKSASSDEFHSDSGLFRDYGDALDDGSEPKVYIDCKTAEKRFNPGRFMKDYGPGEEQDEDWGQGEAMAEGAWRDEVGDVVIDEELPCEVSKELQASTSLCKVDGANLADLVAAAASADHGLIEDESAPEDSLFSSSPPSTSEDSPSPSRHSPAPASTGSSGTKAQGQAARQRRRVRTKKREAKDAAKAASAADGDTKDSCKKPDASSSGEKREGQGHMLSPEGSATPSNSFSLSDGRDFLIDDEIIDQPALTIHNKLHGDESEMASLTESAASITLRDHTSSHHQGPQRSIASARLGQGADRDRDRDGDSLAGALAGAGSVDVRPASRDNTLMMARFGSLDSLATNSIDSEDLMMDFDDDADSKKYRSITKSWGGSPVLFWPRPRKSRSFSHVDLDQLKSVEDFARADHKAVREAKAAARTRSQSVGRGAGGDRVDDQDDDDDDGLMADNDSVLLELSSLIESVTAPKDRAGDRVSGSLLSRHHSQAGHARGPLSLSHSRTEAQASSGPSSAPDSPRYSLGSSGVPSPLRPPRQLASSDSDESAMMRVDRGTYQHMYQDVVHIKTMLLKLKRVLQEAETLNPFESSLKNGLLHQLVHDESGEDDDGRTRNADEEVVDLKRQMVLMKQQMEEKDRTIQLMQVQMMKYERVSEDLNDNGQPTDMCNAATQTERLRPVSAGPSLLQSLPSDSNGSPLVSWNDTWGRRSKTPASGSSSIGSSIIESRTSSTSRVPTVTARSSRSGHQRTSITTPGDSPSSIPLVKGNHRKTGTAIDSVPNTRRPPVVAAPRKVMTSGHQKS